MISVINFAAVGIDRERFINLILRLFDIELVLDHLQIQQTTDQNPNKRK